jgi:hypothetical protein
LEYLVRFTDSCRYNIGKDQSDRNKLFGMTHGLFRNSSRWAWRFDIGRDAIELSPYMHIHGGVARGGYRTWVEIGEEILLGIACEGPDVVYYVQGHEAYRYTPGTKLRFGYEQFPYFGGNVPAPHRIEIVVNDLASDQ